MYVMFSVFAAFYFALFVTVFLVPAHPPTPGQNPESCKTVVVAVVVVVVEAAAAAAAAAVTVFNYIISHSVIVLVLVLVIKRILY